MDSGLDIKDSILKLISRNFDQADVTMETLTEPEAYEIEINNSKDSNSEIKSYIPHNITLSIYPSMISLHIDDFMWEYKNNYQKAYEEIEGYLIALSKGQLVKKGVKLINEHLEIES